jgi:hypothetical protein
MHDRANQKLFAEQSEIAAKKNGQAGQLEKMRKCPKALENEARTNLNDPLAPMPTI